jgi:Mrp family chromosome partitioning ATPase
MLAQGNEDLAISLESRRLIQGDSGSGVAATSSYSAGNRLPASDGSAPHDWHTSQANLATAIDTFRTKHPYVLIDCASMKDSQDAIRLAPLVDGVVFVVEANRTQREQLLYSERAIESAKGRILGHVLNKRTYVIPRSCYRMMEAIGI